MEISKYKLDSYFNLIFPAIVIGNGERLIKNADERNAQTKATATTTTNKRCIYTF